MRRFQQNYEDFHSLLERENSLAHCYVGFCEFINVIEIGNLCVRLIYSMNCIWRRNAVISGKMVCLSTNTPDKHVLNKQWLVQWRHSRRKQTMESSCADMEVPYRNVFASRCPIILAGNHKSWRYQSSNTQSRCVFFFYHKTHSATARNV